MTEWDVVGVIIAIVGLLIAIGGPIIKLNTSITKLISKMDGMGESLADLTLRNSKSHERLWNHNEVQDKKLENHEQRILILEHTDKKGGEEQ